MEGVTVWYPSGIGLVAIVCVLAEGPTPASARRSGDRAVRDRQVRETRSMPDARAGARHPLPRLRPRAGGERRYSCGTGPDAPVAACGGCGPVGLADVVAGAWVAGGFAPPAVV